MRKKKKEIAQIGDEWLFPILSIQMGASEYKKFISDHIIGAYNNELLKEKQQMNSGKKEEKD